MTSVSYTPVSSSNVAAVGYEDSDLYVKFNNGSEYKYSGVPSSIYEQLLNAPSVGSFLNSNIKGSYNFERIA